MQTIAYLGPEDTNTHMAAIKRFGRRADYIHAPTIDEVFHLVEREEAEYGVVPVENSLEGAVTHTLDRFIEFKQTPVTIHGEIEYLITHALITLPGTKLQDIGTVFSHPQALAQCHWWLQKHFPDASPWETTSTSDAVGYLLQKGIVSGHRITLSGDRRMRAAIARPELARKLHLKAILIPSHRENRTRFLILGLEAPQRGTRNKTSVLFALHDKPGALHDALVPFKRQRINLTKIESRPSKRKIWEYLFFIDFEGHVSEPRVKRALKTLEKSTSLLRVLGSYPVTK
jgi:chorismate mutase/prephenate dehydratase